MGYRVGVPDAALTWIKYSDSRAALRASIGLGMKAATVRIVILTRAQSAHPKVLHRRPLAVVRNIFDDGKSRPAVGAVNERMAKAAVDRIEKLFETVVTGGRVR